MFNGNVCLILRLMFWLGAAWGASFAIAEDRQAGCDNTGMALAAAIEPLKALCPSPFSGTSPECIEALDARYWNRPVQCNLHFNPGVGFGRRPKWWPQPRNDTVVWRQVFEDPLALRREVEAATRDPASRLREGQLRPDLRVACKADSMAQLGAATRLQAFAGLGRRDQLVFHKLASGVGQMAGDNRRNGARLLAAGSRTRRERTALCVIDDEVPRRAAIRSRASGLGAAALRVSSQLRSARAAGRRGGEARQRVGNRRGRLVESGRRPRGRADLAGSPRCRWRTSIGRCEHATGWRICWRRAGKILPAMRRCSTGAGWSPRSRRSNCGPLGRSRGPSGHTAGRRAAAHNSATRRGRGWTSQQRSERRCCGAGSTKTATSVGY